MLQLHVQTVGPFLLSYCFIFSGTNLERWSFFQRLLNKFVFIFVSNGEKLNALKIEMVIQFCYFLSASLMGLIWERKRVGVLLVQCFIATVISKPDLLSVYVVHCTWNAFRCTDFLMLPSFMTDYTAVGSRDAYIRFLPTCHMAGSIKGKNLRASQIYIITTIYCTLVYCYARSVHSASQGGVLFLPSLSHQRLV